MSSARMLSLGRIAVDLTRAYRTPFHAACEYHLALMCLVYESIE